MLKKTKVLCILDGFGLTPTSPNNAAALAYMPNFRRLVGQYPWTTLEADGEAVGQEAGLVGNSEVGHMNLGGLQLVKQLSYQITKSAENGFDLDLQTAPDQLFDPKEFISLNFGKEDKSKTVHLVGLFSTGTIHSDLRHWVGAVEAAGLAGAEKIVLHIISDGRDSDRQSLVATWEMFVSNWNIKVQEYQDSNKNQEVKDLIQNLETKIRLGSVGGRFYSMDRDKNWLRTANGLLSMCHLYALGGVEDLDHEYHFRIYEPFLNFIKKYDLDYHQIFDKQAFYRDNEYEKSVNLGELMEDWRQVEFIDQNLYHDSDVGIHRRLGSLRQYGLNLIQERTSTSYTEEVFDETIYPKLINSGFDLGDTIWLLNFRSDRMKQTATMLCDLNQEFKLNLTIVAMNDYGIGREKFSHQDSNQSGAQPNSAGYYPIFKTRRVENTLAQRISQSNATQLHIAETEKYAHVTYFFDGGVEQQAQGEDWMVMPSNKVISHAEKPEMQAAEITDYILHKGLGEYDYVIVNFANPDMVAHTGDIPAAVQSMSVLDLHLGRLLEVIERDGHSLLITADHGNVEQVGAFNVNGQESIDTQHNPNPVPCILVSPYFDRNTFIQSLTRLKHDLDLEVDTELVDQVLLTKQSIDINSPNSWLTTNQIPQPQLPLWYAGALILAM